ncbi:MAG TPA: FMN-binding protein [Clostridia bacterium]|nr:FMN-binding protein [Clostridia bacterium]
MKRDGAYLRLHPATCPRKRRAVTGATASVLSSIFLAGCGSFGAPTLQIPTSLRSGQYTGQDITTRFGDVQVEITVSNGHITDVQAPLLPSDRARSVEISQAAGPILRDEALQAVSAKSAQIDTVSGATYTSDAYVQSLQSAIDQAHA